MSLKSEEQANKKLVKTITEAIEFDIREGLWF